MLMRSGQAAFVAILAVVISGCSLALMAPEVVEGQSFPFERASQLRVGMTPEEVEALLGTPLRRVTGGQTTVWGYDVRRRVRECRYYVGPIPLRPARTVRHALELTFGTAGLIRAVHREEAPGAKTERTLEARPTSAAPVGRGQ
jgi:outer membrane protein assembly factor BamE (lipoprotein component of BamABCDE complex)